MFPHSSRLVCRKLFLARHFHVKTPLIEDLTSRGLISNVTRAEQLRVALHKKQTIYSGIDPSAGSLHVGHLLPMMCLLHFQIRGHQILSLVGGATGLVGDPSGRATERKPADVDLIERNVLELKQNVHKFFKYAFHYASKRLEPSTVSIAEPQILNNLDWWQDMKLLDFLRTAGAFVRVNTMLNRESVQLRMTSQQGISYTEFSYQLLQAYDFYTLHKSHNCSIQIGGSDQWGNILAGLEMINRLDSDDWSSDAGRGFGLTTPLLTTASGEKFGKSTGNAIWLDESLTSVFDFYQFFLKTADSDVEKYLKMFTLLSAEKIAETMAEHQKAPENRIAQRVLADELTELVHGESGINRARSMTKLLFQTDHSGVSSEHIISAMSGDPRLVFKPSTEIFATPVAKLAASSGLVTSASVARNLIQMKGLYFNNKPITDIHTRITEADLIDRRLAILRAGKDKYLVLALLA